MNAMQENAEQSPKRRPRIRQAYLELTDRQLVLAVSEDGTVTATEELRPIPFCEPDTCTAADYRRIDKYLRDSGLEV